MYRRQIVAVMSVLMHERPWLETLLQIEGWVLKEPGIGVDVCKIILWMCRICTVRLMGERVK